VSLSKPPLHRVVVHCEAKSSEVSISVAAPAKAMVFDPVYQDASHTYDIDVAFSKQATGCEEITCHACSGHDGSFDKQGRERKRRKLAGEQTLKLTVSDPKDDGFERDNWEGSSQTSGSRLYIQPGYWVGLRFQKVKIPPLSTVASAKVCVYSAMDSPGDVEFEVFAANPASGSAAQFENWGSSVFSSMARTSATVPWKSTGGWTQASMDYESGTSEQKPKYCSPDISSVIQEVVSGENWAFDNNLAILLKTVSGTREVRPRDYGLFIPEIEITFGVGAAAKCSDHAAAPCEIQPVSASYTVLPSAAPPAVRNLVVADLESEGATLVWDTPVADAVPSVVSDALPVTNYAVSVHEYDSSNKNDPSPIAVIDTQVVDAAKAGAAGGNKFAVTGLNSASTYTFSVYPINAAGAGTVSSIMGTTKGNFLTAAATCANDAAATACSGKGTCSQTTGQCQCNKGFAGSVATGVEGRVGMKSAVTDATGIDCSVSNCATPGGSVCSGAGTCGVSEVCKCDADHFGRRCSIDRSAPTWRDSKDYSLAGGPSKCDNLAKKTLDLIYKGQASAAVLNAIGDTSASLAAIQSAALELSAKARSACRPAVDLAGKAAYAKYGTCPDPYAAGYTDPAPKTPTRQPTSYPTAKPSSPPTEPPAPTPSPTRSPTPYPTPAPTSYPPPAPTKAVTGDDRAQCLADGKAWFPTEGIEADVGDAKAVPAGFGASGTEYPLAIPKCLVKGVKVCADNVAWRTDWGTCPDYAPTGSEFAYIDGDTWTDPASGALIYANSCDGCPKSVGMCACCAAAANQNQKDKCRTDWRANNNRRSLLALPGFAGMDTSTWRVTKADLARNAPPKRDSRSRRTTATATAAAGTLTKKEVLAASAAASAAKAAALAAFEPRALKQSQSVVLRALQAADKLCAMPADTASKDDWCKYVMGLLPGQKDSMCTNTCSPTEMLSISQAQHYCTWGFPKV
jgi:hypothetical protein